MTPVDLAPRPAGKGDLIPDFIAAVVEDRDLSAALQEHFDAVSICAAIDEAVAGARPGEQAADPRQVTVIHEGAEARRQHVVDLLGRAHLKALIAVAVVLGQYLRGLIQ